MGVNTTGDDYRDTMENNAKQLRANLAELLYGNYWGSDDWSAEYRERMATLLAAVDGFIRRG